MIDDELKLKIEGVEREYKADVYLYLGLIDDFGYKSLMRAIVKKNENAILILVTRGGSANSAYQIARILQKCYGKFILFTPSYCKSAGTLIALGAHEVVMDVFSELGPLDVQLPSKDELWDRRSGLISRSAFRSLTEASYEMYEGFMLAIKQRSVNKVSFKLASEISVNLTCQVMTPIYGQLNPDVIGSDFRDLNISIEYGRRLATHSNNPYPDAVEKLVRNYPSHDFIIDNEEAKALFKNVSQPLTSLYELIDLLGYNEQEETIVKHLSSGEGHDCEQTFDKISTISGEGANELEKKEKGIGSDAPGDNVSRDPEFAKGTQSRRKAKTTS